MSRLVASVAVPRPVRRLFTYLVPRELAGRCQRGVRVVVPFGRRRLTGYVLDLSESGSPADPGTPLKPVERVLDPEPVLDEPILELTRWAAGYYVVAWGEMIRAALPGMQAAVERLVGLTPAGRRAADGDAALLTDAAQPRIGRGTPAHEVLALLSERAAPQGKPTRLADLRRRLGPRFKPSILARLAGQGLVEVVEITGQPAPRPRLEEVVSLARPPGLSREALGPRQRAILQLLAERGGRAAVLPLLREGHASRRSLLGLETRGLIRLEKVESSRRPAALDAAAEPARPLAPNPDQQAAIDTIGSLLEERAFATCLIQGVTGSGKTEVYLRSIERVIASGRKAIYLVPEIGLTPLLARRLRARFGEVLALLHSGLSEGERFDEWRRIRAGEVDVVLGARSAVFAPLPDVGLIVVDEEHDGSYKQDESPRYNGRDLAIVRGRMAAAVVLLGSATPSMESYYQAQRGKYRLLRLPSRIGAAGMPEVERIDMRREFQEVGRETILSRRLVAGLEDRLARREQSLVLLNRRGFSTFVLCRACGESIVCGRCSIAMTLHLREQRLRCHYCDERRKVPASCPACGSGHLHFGGTGTERLEENLRARFPGARIARMDRDAARGRGVVESLLTRFERGEIDILLGTQMIAKGHDFPNVTLVGVLAADALLSMPDFRSGERTFQLLAQVAGRSGRGERGGQVIVQAFDPDHHAIRAACEHDLDAFAREEVAYRRATNYPPFSSLALILVRNRLYEKARAQAGAVATMLRGLGGKNLQVLGPAPAPLERLRGEYRVQVLLKAATRRTMQEALAGMLSDLDRRGRRVGNLVIDVDPMSTL